MITALDADVLIYASIDGHELGRRVRPLFTAGDEHLVGSVLLLPEVLAKPIRDGQHESVDALVRYLARLELHALDERTANLATALAARYRLRAADAGHLATAVVAGADRFVTNNRRDFSGYVAEMAIVYPDELPGPDDGGKPADA